MFPLNWFQNRVGLPKGEANPKVKDWLNFREDPSKNEPPPEVVQHLEVGMPIEEMSVKSLAKILEIARSTNESAVFRGENSVYGELLPSIGRAFRWRYPKPSSYTVKKHFKDWEDSLYKLFTRQSEPYMPFVPEQDEIRAIIMGHHHGLPTRFLDWTENILVAAYFAVEGEYGRLVEPEKSVGRRLFIYDTKRVTQEPTELFSINLRLIHRYAPPYLHPRVVRQSSLFTVHSQPYEDMIALVQNDQRYKDDQLTILNIPESATPKIRDELNRLGINSANIWPDLTGVAKFVKWHETRNQ